MKVRIAIAGFLSVVAGWLGSAVPGTALLALFDLLNMTAGIIFGVSGAWIALVHSTEVRSETPQTGRFRDLMRSMLASGAIIVAALAVRGAQAVASSMEFDAGSLAPWLRGAAFGDWSFGVLALVWSIFATVPSALFALGEIENRREHQKIIGRLPRKRRDGS